MRPVQSRNETTAHPALRLRPTDRQLEVRYRYREGLEVPHIVPTRAPRPRALGRKAAALGNNQQGDADTGLVLAYHNINARV